ncbi:MAG: hypothetical protein U0T75_15115 [Chitinophagales bacterium]
MVALSLSVLALAAGVFLLVKVKSQYLGKLFEGLAWLVIVLALVAIGAVGYHALHHCGGGDCHKEQCKVEQKEVIIKEDGAGHCNMGDMAACCKAEGDSMVMDAASCEKMMGKEACEKMMKERGRCIMSKDECAKACEANGGKKDCCANAGGHGGCQMDMGKGECPMMKADGEKPACCKKDK